ncbi:CPBP family intramembrane glutamic endopeptidase [Pedobacter chitinilyticus]|uniref:CPBP family intramembrane metalloprotease n=1 Tax=Pedobacter chitinilyticus TaxID=2233776 RepID=A0A443YX12_9SPHI|nr:type II CAAX endopeptidase family protein [Pedobacter chitinilyticus]RWU08521.1 CPBP family intramembrane metalloprotease [Pedobacter chitinilyticus]
MEHKVLSIFRDIGIIAFLILFPHFVPLPFYSYAIVCLLLIWFVLRREGKTFRDVGLVKSGLTITAVLIGIFSALIWVSFMQFIYIPTIKYFFVVPDYTEYNFIRGSISKLIMIIAAAWLIGGFYEEIVFRGYIQSLLDKRFSKSSFTLLGIIVTSVLFGLYHRQQDIFGVIAAVLGGLFWGIIYKKFGNNLWIPILSHAIFDTITLVLIYIDKFGNLY